MRNEISIDKLGKPVYNRILIKVIDTFDTFMSKGGIQLVNMMHEEAWADSNKFTITEFIPRHGTVVDCPNKITRGTFDYETKNELKEGDIVFWNSISFKEHIPLVIGKDKYLLVDYHDIMLKIRDGKMIPINGYTLLKTVSETTTILAYSVQQNVTQKWEIAIRPERLNIELVPSNEFEDFWEVGDIVRILVLDKPFKIEGFINNILEDALYAVPTKMILCEDVE